MREDYGHSLRSIRDLQACRFHAVAPSVILDLSVELGAADVAICKVSLSPELRWQLRSGMKPGVHRTSDRETD